MKNQKTIIYKKDLILIKNFFKFDINIILSYTNLKMKKISNT